MTINTNENTSVMNLKDIDYVWKIVVCGNDLVGKTTFLKRYIYNTFDEDTRITIGCGMFSQYISKNVDEKKIKINLIMWDLGGQRRFMPLHGAYVGGAHFVLVLFDLGSISSLDDVEKWIQLVRKNNSDDIPIVLVGTKYDMVKDNRKVYSKMYDIGIKKVVNNNLRTMFITSSKDNLNVEKVIEYMIDTLLNE